MTDLDRIEQIIENSYEVQERKDVLLAAFRALREERDRAVRGERIQNEAHYQTICAMSDGDGPAPDEWSLEDGREIAIALREERDAAEAIADRLAEERVAEATHDKAMADPDTTATQALIAIQARDEARARTDEALTVLRSFRKDSD